MVHFCVICSPKSAEILPVNNSKPEGTASSFLFFPFFNSFALCNYLLQHALQYSVLMTPETGKFKDFLSNNEETYESRVVPRPVGRQALKPKTGHPKNIFR